ncbi:uncharacterized protein BX664DRAFT_321071 [Halteromyces radiatus]|uniref:uncharacterized protein n=1 Tax=Halteromyces radiatus TaxID=101107 RepID=UPI00222090F4|nr:uncharacterized protein BX664DRAFT_321071 [Halteromyces radiatus]KAI8099358.1 hypothetical protein BX664DRAFT_321071 [Halteromyces radiatus]
MSNQKNNTAIQSRFHVDPKHINNKFEGYKLYPFPESTDLTRTPLPSGNLDVSREGQQHSTRLGFRELQARVRFNHLAYGCPINEHVGVSYFVDEEYTVKAVTFDKRDSTTHFSTLVTLTRPLHGIPNYAQPDRTVPLCPEYPSLIALGPELVLACNGVGDIELIGIEQQGQNKLLGTTLSHAIYEGEGNEGISPVPCVLLAARRIKSKVIMVVYSQAATKKTRFNIATLEMDIPTSPTTTLDLPLTTRHIQQGLEVPVYCAITADGSQCIYGSEARYSRLSPDQNDTRSTATEMEIDKARQHSIDTQQPIYQWTQDGSDITIQFELPAGTPSAAISCQITRDHLMLIVRAQQVEFSFPYRKWWTNIIPGESTWTIEPSGLLSLFIVKQDARSRWPHIFETDDGVLETIDKERLKEIAKQMEKFTSDTVDNGPLMQQHPAATDMDEDVDEHGQPITFEIFDMNGECIQEITSSGQEWLSNAFESPTTHHQHHYQGLVPPSVVCKSDVDGLVYTWDNQHNLTHTATFDAFGFVQASKRDSRFVRHDPGLGFITIVESSRNCYIYYRHDDHRLIEKQTLVDLTQGHDVDILGVQLILDRILMVLTESEIITILV